ncbi:MAG TPA: glycosyltransferase [bacterium]|nr:glycosyltransferase [bacterium]
MTNGEWRFRMRDEGRRAKGAAMVRFVSRRFGHHGEHTGYWLLAARWPGNQRTTILPGSGELVGPAWAGPVEARLVAVARALTKCMLGAAASFGHVRVLHVLYGENDLPIPRFPGSCRIVTTLHQPASFLGRDSRRVQWLRHRLRNVDLIVALSSEQSAFVQSVVPDKQCVFVPHGVDTDFFNSRGFSRGNTILISAGWLRDMDFARDVARHAVAIDPSVTVRVFGNNATQLAGVSSRVQIMSHLNDEELRREYSSCAVMLLPLLGTVANNALLEALSCGTSIVAPDLPATVEYLGENGTYYARTSSAEDVAELLCSLVEENSQRPRQGLRERALSYDWSRIVPQMASAYESICG